MMLRRVGPLITVWSLSLESEVRQSLVKILRWPTMNFGCPCLSLQILSVLICKMGCAWSLLQRATVKMK